MLKLIRSHLALEALVIIASMFGAILLWNVGWDLWTLHQILKHPVQAQQQVSK